ncbi:MAG: TetR/AcrR family transcriptional regulator [Stackebrandtia sp.]
MTDTAPRHLTPAARRVLDTAADLFYNKGINTVGMDLVAATAKVTKKTIYDRFGSKDALVAAYLDERDQGWRQWLLTRVADIASPRGKVLASFDALAEWVAGNQRGCAMINAVVELPDSTHPGHQVATRQKQWLWQLYRDWATELGTAAPDRTADALLVLHEGAIAAHHVAGRSNAIPAARRTAAAVLAADTAD